MKIFEKELNELEKYDVETKHTKKYFFGQRDRYLRNYLELKKIISFKDKILDVGSNPLYFLATLKRLGYEIEGIDLNPDYDSYFISQERLIIKKCDIEKERFPYKDESFDKIIFSEVFEHLYVNQIHCLNELRRILKKGGKLILTTPNGYSLKRILNFILGKGMSEDPYKCFEDFIKMGIRGHIREYSSKEINNFLKRTGFTVKKGIYLFYPHQRIKDKFFLSNLVSFFYLIFPTFRSHIIFIIEKNEKI